MKVVAAHHVSFSVSDLERSRAFYGGLLGLEEIPRPDLGLAGAWFAAGPVELHLIAAPEGPDLGRPPASISPIANHFAFRIDDYARVRDDLAARGVELVEAGAETGQMWIRDPDGNVIELIVPGGRR